jgi:hypothetical protein
MYIGLHVKYFLFLSGFDGSYLGGGGDFEKYSNIKFMKIRPLGAELFHVDGQTDRQTGGLTDMKIRIVAFSQF